MVASTASWHPPNSGRPPRPPQARPSAGCGSATSKSRTMTFWVTLPPASRHTRPIALSKANPLAPTRPRVHTMLGGGQICRFGGHTGMSATTDAVGVEDVATSRLGRGVTESLSGSAAELLTKPIELLGQPVTSPALSRWGANDQTLPLGVLHLRRNHMLPTSVTSWLQCLRFHG